jgi:hypothetical protein
MCEKESFGRYFDAFLQSSIACGMIAVIGPPPQRHADLVQPFGHMSRTLIALLLLIKSNNQRDQ